MRLELDKLGPWPTRRIRTLTHPLLPNMDDDIVKPWDRGFLEAPPSEQRTLDQSQSPLFSKLPLELRQLIWSAAIGGHLFHVKCDKGERIKLVAIECTQDTGRELNTRDHACWRLHQDFDSAEGQHGVAVPHHSVLLLNLLPLLQTCRMIYTEAVPILYSENAFDFRGLETIVQLDKKVLPRRLAQIRTVNTTWDSSSSYLYRSSGPFHEFKDAGIASAIFAVRFTGLWTLTLHVRNCCSHWSGQGWHQRRCESEYDFFRKIRARDRFDIYHTFWDERCAEVARQGGYPFTVLSDVNPPKPDPYANPYSDEYNEALRLGMVG